MNERFDPFLRQLRLDLAQPLPGRAWQYQMAPRPRPGAELFDSPRPDSRRGGVLALFYPHNETIYLPLILRPTYPGVHSAQVGFPGGGAEEMDDDLTATALREAYEEVGVHPSQVTILGLLTPLYVSASNYIVQPVVAWADYRPEFHPDPFEVAQLLEAPLPALLTPASRRTETRTLRGQPIEVPYFAVAGQIVWGATAMMLSELLALSSMKLTPAGTT